MFAASKLKLIAWDIKDRPTAAGVRGSITIRGLLKKFDVVESHKLLVPWRESYQSVDEFVDKHKDDDHQWMHIHKDRPCDSLNATWCLAIYEQPVGKLAESRDYDASVNLPTHDFHLCMCLKPINIERMRFQRVGVAAVPDVTRFRTRASFLERILRPISTHEAFVLNGIRSC